MPAYQAPLRDFDFVLNELIGVQDILPNLPGYEDASADVFASYLDAAAKFCENELAPINRAADEEGCHYDASTKSVKTPAGFKEAYQQYCELGFTGPIFGGDTLDAPELFQIAGDKVDGVIFTTFYDAAQPATELTSQFLDAYRAKYGKEPCAPPLRPLAAPTRPRSATRSLLPRALLALPAPSRWMKTTMPCGQWCSKR